MAAGLSKQAKCHAEASASWQLTNGHTFQQLHG